MEARIGRGFEEWRKLSADVRAVLGGAEDYVTARTFGVLRHLPADVLGKILGELGLPAGPNGARVDLWPYFPSCLPEGAVDALGGVEPDVIVSWGGAQVVVEVKFLGSTLGCYLSQLGREWLLARSLANQTVGRGGRERCMPLLVLITPGSVCPLVPAIDPTATALCGTREPRPAGGDVAVDQQILDYCTWARNICGISLAMPSQDEIRDSVRWLGWADLARSCANALQSLYALDPFPTGAAHALADVLGALQVFRLEPFKAWKLSPWTGTDIPTWSAASDASTVSRVMKWPPIPEYMFEEPPRLGWRFTTSRRMWSGVGPVGAWDVPSWTSADHGDGSCQKI